MKSITKAFTLIELLIVIVIIGILAVALIPRLTGAQARARDTARIADMRQMQAALELYAADNGGRYPGGTHYANVVNSGCGQPATSLSRTGIFDNTFITNYISSLPRDPLSSDPSYCYGYSKLDNTSTRCIKKDGTVIDLDGISATGSVTGPQGGYALTFKAETDLWDKYPRWLGMNNGRYCVFEPGR